MLTALSHLFAAARHLIEAIRADRPRLFRLISAGLAALHLIQAAQTLLAE